MANQSKTQIKTQISDVNTQILNGNRIPAIAGKIRKIVFFLAAFLTGIFVSCRDEPANHTDNPAPGSSKNDLAADSNRVTPLNYAVVNVYPHDTTSYTEGFLIHEGELYESTGHDSQIPSTRSLFGVVDLSTGKIRTKVELDKHKYFGEGIVFLNGKVFQLTYRTKVGFVYDDKTFKKLREFTYPSDQGWGMTTDGKYLIMSDSTPDLHYLDPEDFTLIKTIRVKENDIPVDQVNELEYIKGYIYANRYTENTILKIDPASGRVVGKMDLSSLDDAARNKYPGSMQMNGIAYDSVNDKIYVTGKLWPDIYEIRFPH